MSRISEHRRPFPLPACWQVLGLLAAIVATTITAAIAVETASVSALGSHDQQLEFFESKIRPVLIEHCYRCHNSVDATDGGLAVDFRDGLLSGGDSGPILVPGDVAGSQLLAILRHEVEGLEMPEGGAKLDDDVIADIERWIAGGAYDPRDEPPDEQQLADSQSWAAMLERRKSWWSFQPITDPQVPVGDLSLANPIDRFLAAKQQAAGLTANRPADTGTLVRRLYVTLTGLPPTPQQVLHWTMQIDAAAADQRAAAIELLIDELLDSDRFGERWARHWMDWTRYTESHGSEGDPEIGGAWLYRDYLIRAVNADVPIDQMIREHVAGDLLPQPRWSDDQQTNESVIATAHWRMVFHGFTPTDALEERVRFTDDQINTFSKAFLGLTVACARCHDHKFDAISQADYYALYGVLDSGRPGRLLVDHPSRLNQHRARLEEYKRELQRLLAKAWLQQLADLPARLQSLAPPTAEPTPAPEFAVRWLAVLHGAIKTALDSGDQATVQRYWDALQQPGSLTAAVQNAVHAWDLSDDAAYQQWFRHGNGLPLKSQAAGQFAVSIDSDRTLVGIYPAGVYSHTISNKHAARLTSPDIDVDQPLELWVRAIGDHGATLRYVVQNYPRSGTVYPLHRLSPQWTWYRMDLEYWQGDQIHIELTHALDAPVAAGGESRSWFGVQQVLLLPKGSPPPDRDPSPLRLLASVTPTAPTTLQQWHDAVAAAYQQAIADWAAGRADDAAADWLQHGVSPAASGVLSDRLLIKNASGDIVDVSWGATVARYRSAEAEIAVPRRVPGFEETTGHDQPLLVRGDHKQPAAAIPRRFLEAINPTPFAVSLKPERYGDAYQHNASGRLQLADNLLRDDNPLTRRVMANRIWHHTFGEGLVTTPDNFGRLGDQPVHPELLDWLAMRLTEDGWSLKRMVKRLVSSQAWQTDSTPSQLAAQADPSNRLWSHAQIRRLDAESIRDSLLMISGKLDRKLYGPPVSGQTPRRSLYVRVHRNSLEPLLRVFDFPEPFSATGRRDATNVPAQSLTLMNDPQVVAAARAWAAQLLADPSLQEGDVSRLNHMMLAAVGRPSNEQEAALMLDFLQQTQQRLIQQQTGRDTIARELESLWRRRDQLLAEARMQYVQERVTLGEVATLKSMPPPLLAWDFHGPRPLNDLEGRTSLTLHENARVAGYDLITYGRGYAVSPPLTEVTRRQPGDQMPVGQVLGEKTLEAWVRTGDLSQQGGGVITVQSLDGQQFDSIVFGETDPGHWIAGSDFHRRTQAFHGSKEDATELQTVHIAISYHSDGTIAAYRNGQLYGTPYQSELQTFAADQTVVTLGLRHLPAGGNRYWGGHIERAKVYDVALTAKQIAASFASQSMVVDESEALALMTADQRAEWNATFESERAFLQQQFALSPAVKDDLSVAAWAELTQSLFTLPEFLFVR